MTDTEILEDLGLTKTEVKVYLALLELGSSSAGKILEKSKLPNSTVHRDLNSLIVKGLISFILEGKRKVYQASNPENFFEFIADKKRRFENKLPSRQIFDESVKEGGKEIAKNPLTKIRYVDKEFAQFQETVISGDFVAIAVFTENPYAFLIKDNSVAESYRKYFELLWKNAISK